MALAWNPNSEPDLAGYKIYCGISPGKYLRSVDLGHVTTVTVSNLVEGQIYFCAVTAYDIFGNESGFSNEVSMTISPSSSTSGGITLSAIGYEVKGSQKADLNWDGLTSTNVDIFRNGSKIATIGNDGSYTDHINRGKGTYTYQVCGEGTSTCSNEARVTKFN